MIKIKEFIIISFILIYIINYITDDKNIKHEKTIDSIQIRNLTIDSLNNELNKLKGIKFDTLKIKEDIKISDEKINKIKHDKISDTITNNSIDEYRKFFSVYLQSKK